MREEERPRLQVDWEDDRVRARHRDSALAALVLHLALLLVVLFNPGLLSGGQPAALVVDLSQQPDVTVLYLPSDVAPTPESRTPPDLTPEESRRAVVHSPLTLDPKELQRILPPRQPVPLTPPVLNLPETPSGGGSQAASQPPAGQPGEQKQSGTEIARLEDLPTPPRKPGAGLDLPLKSPGRAIEESLRPGQGVPGQSPGTGGPGGPPGPIQPNFNTPLPTILSDTRGVDFGPYLIRLLREVRQNWYAVIPVSARLGEQGKVVIVFSIQKDGAVPLGQPVLVYSSGRSHLDRPALAAIRASQPFPPLPAEFTGPNLVLQFTFLYNLPLDYTGP